MEKTVYIKLNLILMALFLLLGTAPAVFSQTVKTVGASGADYPNMPLAFEAIKNRTITRDIKLYLYV